MNDEILFPKDGPFQHRETRPWGKVKRAIATVVLFPARFVLFLMTMLMLYGVGYMVYFGKNPDPTRPPKLHELRTKIMMFAGVVGSRLVLFALGYWYIDVTRLPGAPKDIVKAAPIVAANHTTYADGWLMFYLARTSFVAKGSLKNVPLFGYITACIGGVWVNRGGGGAVAREIVKRSKSPGIYQPIGIFPEGTTTNGDALIHFHKGAFLPGVPVQPLLFKYDYKWFSVGWGDIPKWHLIGVMCQWSNSVRAFVLPTYFPDEVEKANPQLYANHVRAAMSSVTALPVVEYTMRGLKVNQVDYDPRTGLPRSDTQLYSPAYLSKSPKPLLRTASFTTLAVEQAASAAKRRGSRGGSASRALGKRTAATIAASLNAAADTPKAAPQLFRQNSMSTGGKFVTEGKGKGAKETSVDAHQQPTFPGSPWNEADRRAGGETSEEAHAAPISEAVAAKKEAAKRRNMFAAIMVANQRPSFRLTTHANQRGRAITKSVLEKDTPIAGPGDKVLRIRII